MVVAVLAVHIIQNAALYHKDESELSWYLVERTLHQKQTFQYFYSFVFFCYEKCTFFDDFLRISSLFDAPVLQYKSIMPLTASKIEYDDERNEVFFEPSNGFDFDQLKKYVQELDVHSMQNSNMNTNWDI